MKYELLIQLITLCVTKNNSCSTINHHDYSHHILTQNYRKEFTFTVCERCRQISIMTLE